MNTQTVKVNRVYFSENGRFARLTGEFNTGRRMCKLDFKTFASDIIDTVKACKVGQTCEIGFILENECVKDKTGNDVVVDGYKLWVPSLIIKQLNGVEQTEQPSPQGNDSVPF